jgi:hypothetical protein
MGFAQVSRLTSTCRVENPVVQAPAAIEHNQILFVFGGMEEPRAGAQYKSDSGSLELQSISLQVD